MSFDCEVLVRIRCAHVDYNTRCTVTATTTGKLNAGLRDGGIEVDISPTLPEGWSVQTDWSAGRGYRCPKHPAEEKPVTLQNAPTMPPRRSVTERLKAKPTTSVPHDAFVIWCEAQGSMGYARYSGSPGSESFREFGELKDATVFKRARITAAVKHCERAVRNTCTRVAVLRIDGVLRRLDGVE